MEKLIIYQVLPRLFGNTKNTNKLNGTILENGCGKFGDLSNKALQSIHKLGCNCIWYTGVIQHATKTDYSAYGIPKNNPYIVKGEAGSPYAITDYYSVDPDLAENPDRRMEEFEALIARTKANGLKVIIDFVPNHVAREYHATTRPKGVADLGADDCTDFAFHPQNNFYYIPGQGFAPRIDLGEGNAQYIESPAKATGNDCFHAYPGRDDWYETVKLNYGVDYSDGSNHFEPTPSTWLKMLDILNHWASKKIDGFRCDMAHMVPIEFWEWAIPRVKSAYPEILFIAEIYSPELYHDYLFRGKFDYLYDKVGLYDTLRAITEGSIPASCITAQWQQLNGIEHRMLNFLENHDEQRCASNFFARNAVRAIPALLVSALMNVNPFMIYFGQELGERGMDAEGFSGLDGRTTIFDYFSMVTMRAWNNQSQWNTQLLTTEQRKLRNSYQRVLTICNNEKAIREGVFFDLIYANHANAHFCTHTQYAFLRKMDNELLICVVNFSDQTSSVEVVIPKHAFEFLNIQEGYYLAEELLSNSKITKHLTDSKPFKTEIAPSSGVVWKIVLPA